MKFGSTVTSIWRVTARYMRATLSNGGGSYRKDSAEPTALGGIHALNSHRRFNIVPL
jgi:hypothetical protein